MPLVDGMIKLKGCYESLKYLIVDDNLSYNMIVSDVSCWTLLSTLSSESGSSGLNTSLQLCCLVSLQRVFNCSRQSSVIH